MTLQLLVAAVNRNVIKLSGEMNINSDAIIANQGNEFSFVQYKHNGYNIQTYTFAEKGVGLNRNTALMRADADIVLFADEDIIYEDDYAGKVLAEFEKNPDADMILFNFEVAENRRTYHIDSYGRVRFYNCGRYPTYSMAVRLDRIRKENIHFSLLFGGGAKYSCGEDSIFIADCIRHGLHVYKTPVQLGMEKVRKSSWFDGYTEKFFFDRGALYHSLYGWSAGIMAKRFLAKNSKTMCQVINRKTAAKLMTDGIREAKGKRK